ncbi:MAG: DNA polymerase ligase N-terminal domain-containing protein [Parcubacteria group bacterium]
MSLHDYKAKRRFNKTAEPRGKLEKSAPGDLLFVVQEHHASHLHFDLRLEWKGVLMSWAIPKEPKNDVVKRLAVHVEDHPVEYAKFEGEIPQGEYGGGTVKIWDKGIWIPESVGDDKIVFELKGDKLNGKFVLVKFKNKKNNWLFFKLK